MKAVLYPALAVLAVTSLPTAAAAQAVEIIVTPYFWAAGLEGDVAPVPGLPTVHTQSDFDEILDTLQLGLASAIEVRKGRWAFIGDISYVDTGTSAELAQPYPPYDSAGLDTKSLAGTLAGTFQVMESESGNTVDLLAGARINWAQNDIRLMTPVGDQIRAADNETWVDPVIGIRGVAWLAPKWSVTGYADVGGFGLSSDLTWQAMATVRYHVNDRFAVALGYRHYAIDYDHDGFVLDVAQYGPLLGASIRF